MALGQRGEKGFIQLSGTGVFPHLSKTSQSFLSTSNTAEQIPHSTCVELRGSMGQILTTVKQNSPFRKGALPAEELAASAQDGKSTPGTNGITQQTSR